MSIFPQAKGWPGYCFLPLLSPVPSGPPFFTGLTLSHGQGLFGPSLTVALTRALCLRPPAQLCTHPKIVIPFCRGPVIWSNSMHPSPTLIGQLSQVLTQGVQLARCYLGMNWLKPFHVYEPYFNDVGDNTCNSSQSGDSWAQLLPQ